MLYKNFFNPLEIPLIDTILLGIQNSDEYVNITDTPDETSLIASEGTTLLVLLMFGGFVFLALGSIMKPFISGGL